MSASARGDHVGIRTYIVNGTQTWDECREGIRETHARHGPTLQAFHEAWYHAGHHTWGFTHFLGIGLMKCPFDLWTYQDLLTRFRPRTVIETGTYAGGSALWLAYLMEMLDIDGGRVYTIDNIDNRQCDHPRITFLDGDSTDEALVAALANVVQRPLLVTLDSDHSEDHVYRELQLYAPLVKLDEWLVVEDTNVSWLQARPDDRRGDGGARRALERYLRAHEGEFVQDILCEKYMLTMNPGGWLQRVATCAHGDETRPQP